MREFLKYFFTLLDNLLKTQTFESGPEKKAKDGLENIRNLLEKRLNNNEEITHDDIAVYYDSNIVSIESKLPSLVQKVEIETTKSGFFLARNTNIKYQFQDYPLAAALKKLIETCNLAKNKMTTNTSSVTNVTNTQIINQFELEKQKLELEKMKIELEAKKALQSQKESFQEFLTEQQKTINQKFAEQEKRLDDQDKALEENRKALEQEKRDKEHMLTVLRPIIWRLAGQSTILPKELEVLNTYSLAPPPETKALTSEPAEIASAPVSTSTSNNNTNVSSNRHTLLGQAPNKQVPNQTEKTEEEKRFDKCTNRLWINNNEAKEIFINRSKLMHKLILIAKNDNREKSVRICANLFTLYLHLEKENLSIEAVNNLLQSYLDAKNKEAHSKQLPILYFPPDIIAELREVKEDKFNFTQTSGAKTLNRNDVLGMYALYTGTLGMKKGFMPEDEIAEDAYLQLKEHLSDPKQNSFDAEVYFGKYYDLLIKTALEQKNTNTDNNEQQNTNTENKRTAG